MLSVVLLSSALASADHDFNERRPRATVLVDGQGRMTVLEGDDVQSALKRSSDLLWRLTRTVGHRGAEANRRVKSAWDGVEEARKLLGFTSVGDRPIVYREDRADGTVRSAASYRLTVASKEMVLTELRAAEHTLRDAWVLFQRLRIDDRDLRDAWRQLHRARRGLRDAGEYSGLPTDENPVVDPAPVPPASNLDELVAALEREPRDADRLGVLQSAVMGRGIVTDDALRLLGTFKTYEALRMQALISIRPKLLDPENGFKLFALLKSAADKAFLQELLASPDTSRVRLQRITPEQRDALLRQMNTVYLPRDVLRVLEQSAPEHWFNVEDVKLVAQRFFMPSDMLSAIRLMKPRILDPQNAHQLATLSSSPTLGRELQTAFAEQ